MKGLIVTADDFGASVEVNEAVERAHRDGVLTCASLMVSAPESADAVARARAMPKLGVGLHLVLVEGRPVLPPSQIPALVQKDGTFREDMVRVSIEMALLPAVKRQLADEIEAQFEAFAATGLKLDHVNAHKHFHLHPTIAKLMIGIGRRYGLDAVRAPREPLAVLRRIEPAASGGEVERFCAARLRDRLWAESVWSPDHCFGLCWSGAMSEKRLSGLMELLPDGVSEIYLHPATGPYPGSTPGYRYAQEYAALMAPEIAARARALSTGSFEDFARQR
ncbi:MAG TPA: hopanoid biosynthesis-associated protein HpnK [Rhizomicrobium sp.]|nr:hopanoid biosynthesis-associated protein HpnK [Rhizomicrobium sp.]